MEVDEVLERYYGFKDFKPIQRKLIFKILGNNDVLAILKTGYGKSLIYQIAGLMLEGITVVITPLISLMKDQVDSLNRKNIKACYINSLMSLAEQKKIYERIDDYRFIFSIFLYEKICTASSFIFPFICGRSFWLSAFKVW